MQLGNALESPDEDAAVDARACKRLVQTIQKSGERGAGLRRERGTGDPLPPPGLACGMAAEGRPLHIQVLRNALRAHTALGGWTLSERTLRHTPGAKEHAASSDTRKKAFCYGVTPPDHHQLGKSPTRQSLVTAMASISAARLAVGVAMSSEHAEGALAVLARQVQALRGANDLAARLEQALEQARMALRRCRAKQFVDVADAALVACAKLDEAYYALYYHSIVNGIHTVPQPHVYFTAIADAHPHGRENEVRMSRAVGTRQEFRRLRVWDARKHMTMGGRDGGQAAACHAAMNPLLAVLWARWRESATLIHARGVASAKAREFQRAVSLSDPTKRDVDGMPPSPPCTASIQAWRDSSRVWACRIYSFAVPNAQSLRRLASLSPIVEVGAGTGYWASLLRARGAIVAAFDATGRDQPGTPAEYNEYHGECPFHTDVMKGTATKGSFNTTLQQYKDYTLLMCYAPPDGKMAVASLKAYRGDTVALIGEVDGDTASRGLLSALRTRFLLVSSVALPQFDDTANRLDIWQIKREDDDIAKPVACCSQCGSVVDDVVELRRCVLCRIACYCSRQCCLRNWQAHERLHRGRHIPRGFCRQYSNDHVYQPLKIE